MSPLAGMKKGQGRRLWVGGDIAEAGRVKNRLAGSGERTMVGKEEDAGEILLCEGEGWSFRQCIARLEVLGSAGSKRIFLHAVGSDSAVGSPERGERGEALIL